jgi:hypothetical protein
VRPEQHLVQLHLDHAKRHVKAADRCLAGQRYTQLLAHLKDAREDLRWAVYYLLPLAEEEATR